MNPMKAWIIRGVLAALIVLAGSVQAAPREAKTAVFAGGCFWCMQSEFDSQPGVLKTIVGYTGGHTEKPTYEEVGTGTTGHRESILVEYDPKMVNYPRLLEIFWSNVDPLNNQGQFVDRGSQYRAAIFVADKNERLAAEASKAAVAQKLKAPVVTDILDRQTFYPAEADHQEYYKKNPLQYELYHQGSGRPGRLQELKNQSGGGVYRAH